MLLESTQTLLVVCLTPFYLLMSFVLALFALQFSPSFVPLVLLLAVLRLFVILVIARKHAAVKLVLTTTGLAVATTLANIRSPLNAIPEVHLFTVILALFSFSFLTSILVIAAILLDMSLRSRDDHGWSPFMLFPAVWSTVLLVASVTSPLGYLATWSPVVGDGAYAWIRPILGPTGIDWIVGAWATVLSELVGAWTMGPSDQDNVRQVDSLISTSSDYECDELEKPTRAPWLACMATLLCLGTIPSYFHTTLPMPVNSGFTTPLSVACALPYIENMTRLPAFDELLQESTTLTSLAKVVLWPEGAVRFDSVQAKREAIERIAGIAAGSVVSVSFEDHMNDTAKSDKIRNGLMLIDRGGLVFEYFKRHLVPFVESNAMVAYSSPPELFDYQLVTKRNSRKKATGFLTVPMTVSICMDFAHPMLFNELPRRPSLILGPARTWHPSVGLAMWEQAKARAEEVGSTILWCDGGEEGISGVGGRGTEGGKIVQVGHGSWVHTIGLETSANHGRTFYMFVGPWSSVVLIWVGFWTEKVLEMAIQKMRGSGNIGCGLQGNGLRKRILDSYLAWKRGRQADEADEYTHLL